MCITYLDPVVTIVNIVIIVNIVNIVIIVTIVIIVNIVNIVNLTYKCNFVTETRDTILGWNNTVFLIKLNYISAPIYIIFTIKIAIYLD